MKIRCVNNYGNATNVLVVGKIYETDTDTSLPVSSYRVDGIYWNKDHFEKVNTQIAKADDWVRCIDASGRDHIKVGGHYAVALNRGSGETTEYDLKGIPSASFYANRFELVSFAKVGNKVRCINTADHVLVIGQTYTVGKVETWPESGLPKVGYCLTEISLKLHYWAERFELIIEETPAPQASSKVLSADDQAYAKLFAFFKQPSHSNHCRSCNAPKPCKFHPKG